MTYLKFAGYLAFWGWVVAVTYKRYVAPVTKWVYDALEPGSPEGVPAPRWLSVIIKIALSGVLTYLLGLWPAYCVTRTVQFLKLPDTGVWSFYITAFVICEWTLGVIARKEPYRGFLSVLHIVLAMGFFVMFALNPLFLKTTYPWFK